MESGDWKGDLGSGVFGRQRLRRLEEEGDGVVAVAWVQGGSDTRRGVTVSVKERRESARGLLGCGLGSAQDGALGAKLGLRLRGEAGQTSRNLGEGEKA
jgi:hypothetical protein